MKQNEVRPKYSTVDYSVLKKLNISPTECVYLDMVYYLSRDGWCYKSLGSIAEDMNMVKSSISVIRDRLLDKKLITINPKRQVKTTALFNNTKLDTRGSVQKSNGYAKQAFEYKTNRSKIEQMRSKIGTKNTIEKTKNNKGKFSEKKELIRKAVKTGDFSTLKSLS